MCQIRNLSRVLLELWTVAKDAGDDQGCQALTSTTLSKDARRLSNRSRTREQNDDDNLYLKPGKVWMKLNHHRGWQAGATLADGKLEPLSALKTFLVAMVVTDEASKDANCALMV